MVVLTRALAALTAAVSIAAPLAAEAKTAPRHHRPVRHPVFEPYYGCVGGEGWPVYCAWFAIPPQIVNCESHGLVHEASHPDGSSGLYQIEPGTWTAYGGPRFELPYEASAVEQNIVASRIWDHGRGASNWSCAYITGWL